MKNIIDRLRCTIPNFRTRITEVFLISQALRLDIQYNDIDSLRKKAVNS